MALRADGRASGDAEVRQEVVAARSRSSSIQISGNRGCGHVRNGAKARLGAGSEGEERVCAQPVDSRSEGGRQPARPRRERTSSTARRAPGSCSSERAIFAVGVEDGGVVAATELRADGREALVGELARQVHGDLAGEDDGAAGDPGRASAPGSTPNAAAAASWTSSSVQLRAGAVRGTAARGARARARGWPASPRSDA